MDQGKAQFILNSSIENLRRHEDEINRLNVFPVPDGDTGTNMLHTMISAVKEVAKVEDSSAKDIWKAITYGSLMGARGNSGVILSQIIKGICDELANHHEITTEVLIKALRNGAKVAYQAVKKPVEGTMLTVIKDIAMAAERISKTEIQPTELLEYVLEEAEKSVERTPKLLQTLKDAGVVDAGGYGLVIIGRGILAAIKGEQIKEKAIINTSNISVTRETIEYAYCIELMIKSNGIDMKSLESELDCLGDSMLVVGTPELTKVHIHTNDPGRVLQIATNLGSIDNVQINNIIEQSAKREQAVKEDLARAESKVGVVAVANGNGIKDILLSLGVDRVVDGGQSMNPSTADILKAVNDIPSNEVIILPNNKNIILAAHQVASLTSKRISVIPTKTIPEGFSALLSFDKDALFEKNVSNMYKAINSIKTGEVTYATRDGQCGEFKNGDYIGLFNGKIRKTGVDLISTTVGLICDMIDADDEAITILAGEQVSKEEMDKLKKEVEDKFPNIELEIHNGNQPIYYFIIGVE
ncbi:MAG: DAK2 domain-containing protein [Actinomycetota bacterium]|nr:DAK2 domain-containing protein [Actinomycetota bacterium]